LCVPIGLFTVCISAWFDRLGADELTILPFENALPTIFLREATARIGTVITNLIERWRKGEETGGGVKGGMRWQREQFHSKGQWRLSFLY
jgi:hypothetical protein